MDTITHGIAGALIGKASFGGDDLVAFRPMSRARVATWAAMLGAIFPDSDILRDIFSHNPLLIMTWHRSVTHSLVCMPLFAVALAALTRWVTRALKWEAPSFAMLTLIYAVGILSHILLDLATSFGTMIWSPLEWSRPAWDLLFIVDFTFSALLLGPQLLAWVYHKPENLKNRASITWSLLALATVGVTAIAQNVGAPISVAGKPRDGITCAVCDVESCGIGGVMRVRGADTLCASRGARAGEEICRRVSVASGVVGSAAAAAIVVALGWTDQHAARCV